ncbi:MAG: hypothetical protein NTW87_16090, partial [Planctomycetota bacterium]|nr:hypothetical protein [Planctomycetota bacterium]
SLAPELYEYAQQIRRLADAEHALYKKPADYDLRYRGGAAPPPVPMFGRLYLFARAAEHSAAILRKYAGVLDQAAIEIPRCRSNEQDLAKWLNGRAAGSQALRLAWQKQAGADLATALPAAAARLSVSGAPDPLRQRMLEDLQNVGALGAACDQALADLSAAAAALAAEGDLAAKTRAAADAAERALAALRTQEPALRVLRVRSVEQDLSYFDLTPDDAAKIITPALREQAGAQGEAVARSAAVLQGVAAAARQLAADLNAQREQMQKDLDAAVAALRKTWRDKTSVELLGLRDAEDARKREIAALRTRAVIAAEAEKIAADAAAGAAAPPELAALARLVADLPASKTAAAAVAAVAAARKAVADGELYAAQRAAKIVDRLATKHDMKDLRVLSSAADSLRAWSGAVQSDSLLASAAADSELAVQALDASDLPAARKSMESCSQAVGEAQEGAKEALQQLASRSVVTGLYKCLFDGLFVSLGAAMFSLLAFYIASAAYRAFRVKSAEALLMMVAALLVMLGQIPFGGYLWGRFPEVRLWVLQVFSTPAFRGIALGAAVALLAMAMRMWLSLETSAFYREEEEGGA